MGERSMTWKDRLKRAGLWIIDRPKTSLIALFAVTRLILLAAGCRFDAANLNSWWQIADVTLLQNHLFRTLWYLHSQPPLFNLLIGTVLKIDAAALQTHMWLVYTGITLGGILCFHSLARDLTGRPTIALLVAAWLCISPSVMLFSQKLIYDGLVAALLPMAFWGVHSGVRHRSIARYTLGFGLFAAIILLRTMFHPLIFVLLLGGYLLLLPGERRRLLLGAAGPAALILSILIKNLLLFGFFGLSSWGPVILSENIVDRLAPAEKQALLAEGKLSHFSRIRNFATPAQYVPLMGPLPKTGEPSLDNLVKVSGDPNYHNLIFLKIGPTRMQDAMVALRAYPIRYLKTIEEGLYYFHRPASEFNDLGPNKAIIAPWTRIVNATLYLQGAAWHGPMTREERLAHPLMLISVTSLLLTLLFLGAVVQVFRRIWSDMKTRQWPSANDVTGAAIVMTGFVIVIMASTLNAGENDRAHYAIGPALVLGAMLFLFNRQHDKSGERVA
jgi:hypothetical protein